MKNYNYEPTLAEENQAKVMLLLIYDTINVSIDKMPNLAWKGGGYRASYRSWDHTIEFRTNSWRKMDLITKRMTMCHEVLHALGTNHSSELLYGAGADLLPISLFKLIWGNVSIDVLMDKLNKEIMEIIERNQKC